ncbi:MAG: response regulator [Spirochaetales bacterium]|nr:response regulator [Spirochaetales bacterium]
MITLVTADDEEIARKSLEFLIMTELCNVSLLASACNGAELITIVEQYNPDLAIVDINMPGINGIDAIQFLQNRGCKTKFILLTAYGELSYLRQAIELKVSGYLLKSDKREQTIESIKTIVDDIIKLRQEQENLNYLKDIDSRMLPIVENEIMYSIFLDQPASDSFKIYCKLKNLSFSGFYMVNILPTKNTEEIYSSLFNREVFSKKEIDSILGAFCKYISHLSYTSGSLLVFVPGAVKVDPSKWVYSAFETFRKVCIERFGVDFIIGISGFQSVFSDIGKAHKECISVLEEVCCGGVFTNTENRFRDNESIENKIAEEFLHCVNRGISSEILETAEKNKAESESYSVSVIYDEICRLAVSFKDISSRLCITLLKNRPQARKCEDIKELADFIVSILEQHNGNYQEDNNPHAVRAYEYIKEHSTEDISLTIVADEIGISPFYLSRLIKQTYKATFIDLLTGLRVAQAIELVKTSKIQVNEISKRVGYANTAYFCKVFKRYTGKSISEYRNDLATGHIRN